MVEKDASHIAPSLADPEKIGAWTMFIAGWKPCEIEAETGIPQGRIRLWAHREKWTEQKAKIEALRDKKHPAVEQPIARAVAKNPKGEMREKYLKNTGVVAMKTSEHWASMEPEELLAAASQVATLDKMNRGTLEIDAEDNTKGNTFMNLTFLTNADQPGMVRLLEPDKVKEITDAEPTP